jgi:predicted tellurium resistance membrane protein TerC
MEIFANPEVWIPALATLTLLEIILGIDNVIFISILAGKLPEGSREKARKLGLALAMVVRILLLSVIAWLARLTTDLFTVLGHGISGRDLILIAGGLFLIFKSTHEIHEKLEGEDGSVTARVAPTFTSVIIQILLIDVVFSLDSVITAIGMAKDLWVMITAVVISMLFMIMFSGVISNFVQKHPTLKMLALSFLILIGVALIGEGLEQHIPKGYIYFAMFFSAGVEALNIRMSAKRKSPPSALEFKQPYR